MPSLNDQSSSIIGFHYEEPELHIMDKGTENNHPVHPIVEYTIQNVPNGNNHYPNHQAYPVVVDRSTAQNIPNYSFNNNPDHHYSVFECTVQDVPKKNNHYPIPMHQPYPVVMGTVQNIPNGSNCHTAYQTHPIVQDTALNRPNCNNHPDQAYHATEHTIWKFPSCNNFPDHQYSVSEFNCQTVTNGLSSLPTRESVPNLSSHISSYNPQQSEDEDSDIEIIEVIDQGTRSNHHFHSHDKSLGSPLNDPNKPRPTSSISSPIARPTSQVPQHFMHNYASNQTSFKSVETLLSESNSKKVKIVNEISKIDVEIVQISQHLKALKVKEVELFKRRAINLNGNLDQPLYFSLEHKIYSENRAKANQNSTLILQTKSFGLPLYNQPIDTDVYHKNLEKHKLFKTKLVAYLQKNEQETIRQYSLFVDRYTNLMEIWKMRTKEIESSQMWQEKQSEYYKCFSKQFSEVRKKFVNRENIKERRAEPLTVLPNLSDKKHFFITNRDPRLIEDPLSEHELNAKIFQQKWSTEERETFVKHFYKKDPKKFTSEFAKEFKEKSVKDCVQFYYLNKYKDDLREVIFRKKRKGSTKEKIHLRKRNT